MKNFKYSLLCLSLLAGLSVPAMSVAQSTGTTDLTHCENYEYPAQVLASLTSDLREVYAGAAMPLTPRLINASDEPLIDAVAYLKIVAFEDVPRVVALLRVPFPLPLPPGAEVISPVEWVSSPLLTPGSYAAEFVVFAHGRAAKAGTLDATITGSPYYFTVTGGESETVGFLSGSILVNGKKVVGTGGVYEAPETGTFTIELPVVNETPMPIKSAFTWSVYRGPTLVELLSQSESMLKAHPEDTGTVMLRIDDATSPEYIVTGEGEVMGAKLFSTFVLKRSGVQPPQLVSAGIGRSNVGGARSLYACVISETVPWDQVRLVLTAKRDWLGFGWPFAKSVYEGQLEKGTPLALTKEVGEGVSGYVNAELYVGGELVDELTVPYGAGSQRRDLGTLFIILALLCVVGGTWWYLRR